MFSNPWLQYVKLYQKKHPELSYKEVLQEAPVSYKKLKKQYGGNGSKNHKETHEWTNRVDSDFITRLNCFNDKKAISLAKENPLKFTIRKSSTKVDLKVPTRLKVMKNYDNYKILEVWAIAYQQYLDDDIVRLNIDNEEEIDKIYKERVKNNDKFSYEREQVNHKITIECLLKRIISDHVDGKDGKIICVHTSHGFCTTEQETFYDTIGEFIYGEMFELQCYYMTHYGSDGDYTKDQINQLKVTKGTSWNYRGESESESEREKKRRERVREREKYYTIKRERERDRRERKWGEEMREERERLLREMGLVKRE